MNPLIEQRDLLARIRAATERRLRMLSPDDRQAVLDDLRILRDIDESLIRQAVIDERVMIAEDQAISRMVNARKGPMRRAA